MNTSNQKTDIPSTLNIRRCLSLLRQRWEDHSPTNPFCLTEKVHDDFTISEFCVLFLMTQRTRRTGGVTTLPSASARLKTPEENTEEESTEERMETTAAKEEL